MPGGWPYNTTRWRKLRRIQLSQEPLCRYCTELGYTALATVVDHITPVRQRPDLAFDQANLQSLCSTCHESAKKREEQQGHRLGCDEHGNPRQGWE